MPYNCSPPIFLYFCLVLLAVGGLQTTDFCGSILGSLLSVLPTAPSFVCWCSHSSHVACPHGSTTLRVQPSCGDGQCRDRENQALETACSVWKPQTLSCWVATIPERSRVAGQRQRLQGLPGTLLSYKPAHNKGG